MMPHNFSRACCSIWRTRSRVSPNRFVGFATALGGFGFSVYLTYLEIFTIDAICQWCVASAILMALLERFRVLVWAGGALLGWVAGDIMATDPFIVGRVSEATAHSLHAWAGPIGAVIVVGVGMFLVRRHRPFHLDETMAAIGLGVGIAGDLLIGAIIPENEALKVWLARGVIAIVLVIGYALSRSRRPVEAEKA